MPDARPEIIFVTGPQKGQRAVLMDNEVIAGRSVKADVKITEETVSRQHLRFALTIDGWMVENLSGNRVEISGQAYKKGRHVLLETGDTITIGAETTLLFVAPGDDPIAAMRIFNDDNPAHPSPVAPPAPAAVEPLPVAAEKPTAAKPKKDKPKKDTTLPNAPHAGDEKKSKKQLYIIIGGVYLLAMVGLFMFLAMARNSSSSSSTGKKPPILNRETMEAALTCELSHSPNAEASAKHLRLAREYYQTRNAAYKNLYLCVKNYRLYLAFRRPDQKTFLIDDEYQYNTAKKELIDKIMSIYDNAWALENGRHWGEAMDEFELIIQNYIPPAELPQFNTTKREVNDVMVLDNVQEHISYISKFLRKRK